MKVRVDRTKCMAYNVCAHLAPAVYDLDDDGIARVVGDMDEVPPELEEEARKGAHGCPVDAIIVEE